MKTRIIVGVTLLIAVLGLGTYASRAAEVSGRQQWTIVNIMDPTLVKDAVVMGPVLIVHDDAKMARGLPCTSFYRFDAAKGPQDEVVSFHCTPAMRKIAGQLTVTRTDKNPVIGIARVTEYQFAGDCEAH